MAAASRTNACWKDAEGKPLTPVQQRIARGLRQSHAPRYRISKRLFNTTLMWTHCHMGAALLAMVTPLNISQATFLESFLETHSGEEIREPEMQRLEAWMRSSRQNKRYVKRGRHKDVWTSTSDSSSDGSCYSISPTRSTFPLPLVSRKTQALNRAVRCRTGTPTPDMYAEKIRELPLLRPPHVPHEKMGKDAAASFSRALQGTSVNGDNEWGPVVNIVQFGGRIGNVLPVPTPTSEDTAKKMSHLCHGGHSELAHEKTRNVVSPFSYITRHDAVVSFNDARSPVKNTGELGPIKKTVLPRVEARTALNSFPGGPSEGKVVASSQPFSKPGASAKYPALIPRSTTPLKPEVPLTCGNFRGKEHFFGQQDLRGGLIRSMRTPNIISHAVQGKTGTSSGQKPNSERVPHSSYYGEALPESSWRGTNVLEGRRKNISAKQSNFNVTVGEPDMMELVYAVQRCNSTSARIPSGEAGTSQTWKSKQHHTNMPGSRADVTPSLCTIRTLTDSPRPMGLLALGPGHCSSTSSTTESGSLATGFYKPRGGQPTVFTVKSPKACWTGGGAILNPRYGNENNQHKSQFNPALKLSPEKLGLKESVSVFGGAASRLSSYVPSSHFEKKREPSNALALFQQKRNDSDGDYDYPYCFHYDLNQAARLTAANRNLNTKPAAALTAPNESLNTEEVQRKKKLAALSFFSDKFRSIAKKTPKVSKSAAASQEERRLSSSAVSNNRNRSSSPPSTISLESDRRRSVSLSPASSSQSSQCSSHPAHSTHRFVQNLPGRTSASRGHFNDGPRTEGREANSRRFPGFRSGSGPVM